MKFVAKPKSKIIVKIIINKLIIIERITTLTHLLYFKEDFK